MIESDLRRLSQVVEQLRPVMKLARSVNDSMKAEYIAAGMPYGDSVEGLQKWVQEITESTDPAHAELRAKFLESMKGVLGRGAMRMPIGRTDGGVPRAGLSQRHSDSAGTGRPGDSTQATGGSSDRGD